MSDINHFRIAIVVSRFNTEVTEKLLAGAVTRLDELGITASHVSWVPGAVEIPIVAQQLAKSQRYDAIIALGAVIRGETTHYDYVCQQVSYGCQKIALDQQLPVIFGVLTTENDEQALERVGGSHGHKGRDAADAAIEMIQLLRTLP
jgi:6,7-dimethyl-8-ribityllumazine synthase